MNAQQNDKPRFDDAGTYIVIGATGGIGRAVCRLLRERSASLLLAARQRDPLQELALELGAESLETEAGHFGSVEKLFEQAAAGNGKIAGVVNCVGSVMLKPAHLTSTEEWNSVIEKNLTSAFAVVRSAGQFMKDGGSVVLLSSAAAQVGMPNHEAIAAAKAGVEGLLRAAAASYAPRNLRVNAVAPGLVRTPATHRLTSNDRSLEASRSMHPLGRIGEPHDIAAAIMWLLDPSTSWVTGQILSVDGGLTTVRGKASS